MLTEEEKRTVEDWDSVTAMQEAKAIIDRLVAENAKMWFKSETIESDNRGLQKKLTALIEAAEPFVSEADDCHEGDIEPFLVSHCPCEVVKLNEAVKAAKGE